MKRLVANFMIFLLLLSLIYYVLVGANDPVENDYGLCQCWYSKDGDTWEEATVHFAELKLGEPFYIKALLKAKQDLNVMAFKISGLGSGDPDFEVLDGPSNFSEYIDVWKLVKNETHEYIWKLRVKPNTTWVNGNSPINMDVQFTKNGNYVLPPFTIVNVYILDELWESNVDNSDDNSDITDTNRGNTAPDFEIAGLLLIICLLVFLRRKKQ